MCNVSPHTYVNVSALLPVRVLRLPIHIRRLPICIRGPVSDVALMCQRSLVESCVEPDFFECKCARTTSKNITIVLHGEQAWTLVHHIVCITPHLHPGISSSLPICVQGYRSAPHWTLFVPSGISPSILFRGCHSPFRYFFAFRGYRSTFGDITGYYLHSGISLSLTSA